MQFSSRMTIAVHILLAIAEFADTFLAQSVNVHPVIIRNTLGKLKAAGIVHVRAGEGGATLANDPQKITLLDIFEAVEKEEDLFHFHEHPNPQCPVGKNMHAILDQRLISIQNVMRKEMRAITLQDLINDMKRCIQTTDN